MTLLPHKWAQAHRHHTPQRTKCQCTTTIHHARRFSTESAPSPPAEAGSCGTRERSSALPPPCCQLSKHNTARTRAVTLPRGCLSRSCCEGCAHTNGGRVVESGGVVCREGGGGAGTPALLYPLSLPHCLSLPPQRSHLLRCLYHPRHQHQHHKAQKVLGREAAPLACLRHQRARARGAQAAEEHRHGPVERAHTLIHEGVLRQLVGCCKRGWKRGIAGRVRRVAWTPLLWGPSQRSSPGLRTRRQC